MGKASGIFRLAGEDSQATGAASRLADTINRIGDHPTRRIAELLPWNCHPA